jgi:hypothetical protein
MQYLGNHNAKPKPFVWTKSDAQARRLSWLCFGGGAGHAVQAVARHRPTVPVHDAMRPPKCLDRRKPGPPHQGSMEGTVSTVLELNGRRASPEDEASARGSAEGRSSARIRRC